MTYPSADASLARRIERAEAHGNARFVEARARISPEIGACWIEVAGASAMFDGADSPFTQTFGLGLFQTPTAGDLARIETFFAERQAPTFHEVSPLSDASLVPLLHARGYEAVEFTNVMYRPVESGSVSSSGVTARSMREGEEGLWARTSAGGWAESGLADFVYAMAQVQARTEGTFLFLAELRGHPIATAGLNVHDGVAHFAGASTVPEGRRQGAQLALLDQRLREASLRGCDLAVLGARPGSGSQRNAERHGFRVAYTRVKWHLPASGRPGSS